VLPLAYGFRRNLVIDIPISFFAHHHRWFAMEIVPGQLFIQVI